jgi:hypothetical protein
MKMSQYLRSCGILEAYEKLLTTLYCNGWPADRSIFNYSAEEILRYGSKFQQEFKGVIGKELEKKAKVIYDTKDMPKEEPKPKNIISVKRDPIEVKSKNSLDLSIFDKPRVQLSRSSKGTDKFRESQKEDDFLQLNLTKPTKKGIILADDPDFTLDRDYYQSEFQRPPEEDEDLLRFSMKSGHRSLDAEPVINTHTHLDEEEEQVYRKNAKYDDTHKEPQLKGRINKSQDSGVNIGRDEGTEEQYSQDGDHRGRGDSEGEDDDRSRTVHSKDRPDANKSKSGADDESKGGRTPNSKVSNDKTPTSKKSDTKSPNMKDGKDKIADNKTSKDKSDKDEKTNKTTVSGKEDKDKKSTGAKK